MDEHLQTDIPAQRSEPLEDGQPLVEATAAEYVGRWNRLVSTTNWEKGRIIRRWRDALIDAGAAPATYSDEAWSRRVGYVSAQHAGRLRRVFQRFGQTYQQYAGLYWSHFQAALDWTDAEMWLEGAVHEGWSVAKMRTQRWDTMGAATDQRPRDKEIVSAEPDEDVDPADDEVVPETLSGSLGEVRGAAATGRDARKAGVHASDDALLHERPKSAAAGAAVEPLRPFAHVPPLPPDLNKAFEAMRRAIVRHKTSGWKKTSEEDVLEVLNVLKQLVLTPTAD